MQKTAKTNVKCFNAKRIRDTLAALLKADQTACDQHVNAWQFSLELGTLLTGSFDRTDLRALITSGYVKHGIESGCKNNCRTFKVVRHLRLESRSCFILTDAGIRIAKKHYEEASAHHESAGTVNENAADSVPKWYSFDGKLTWLGLVVKKYRNPAPNQACVLAAFENKAWARRIDDPLPRNVEVGAKVGLHNTINSLNAGHLVPMIRFGGDGSGRGIMWHPAFS